MQYHVNNKLIEYHAGGSKVFGDDHVLLHAADDLTQNAEWHAMGFAIQPLFDKLAFESFQNTTEELIRSLWRKSGLNVPVDFPLEHYHRLADTKEKHLAAVEFTKLLSVTEFPSGIEKIQKRISMICGIPLEAHNPFDDQKIFHFRVVRPKQGDNNPLHRDVWLEDYSDCINLYIPICGSNELSSLIISPGSHLWSESRVERTERGALINGIKFNVPAVTSINGSFDVVRPNPSQNEVLVFSPYLIHGGAANLNEDVTRISIELRLWRKN
jgi:hypothetical protein